MSRLEFVKIDRPNINTPLLPVRIMQTQGQGGMMTTHTKPLQDILIKYKHQQADRFMA